MHLKEIDTNLLVVLDALLLDASVSKAAARLGRSPSAVSHALSNLRELFDDKLFVRAGQKLVPTARAMELAATVHIIVSGIEGLLRPKVQFDPATQVRQFTFASRETCEMTLLHGLRARIAASAPGITLDWVSLGGGGGLEHLRNGHIQFAMIEGEHPSDAPDLIWRKLMDDPLVTLARPGHALARGRSSLEGFCAASHILAASGQGRDDPLRQAFDALGIAEAQIMSVSSPVIGMLLALEGDGLVTIPASVADTVAPHLRLDRVAQPFAPMAVAHHLCWHRSYERDECHLWLRRQLNALLAKSPPERLPAAAGRA